MLTQLELQYRMLERFLGTMARLPDKIRGGMEMRPDVAWEQILGVFAVVFEADLVMALDCESRGPVQAKYVFGASDTGRSEFSFDLCDPLRQLVSEERKWFIQEAPDIDREFSQEGIRTVLALLREHVEGHWIIAICNRRSSYGDEPNAPRFIQYERRLAAIMADYLCIPEAWLFENSASVDQMERVAKGIGTWVMARYVLPHISPDVTLEGLRERFSQRLKNGDLPAFSYSPIVSLENAAVHAYQVSLGEEGRHLRRQAAMLGTTCVQDLDLSLLRRISDAVSQGTVQPPVRLFVPVHHSTVTRGEFRSLVSELLIPELGGWTDEQTSPELMEAADLFHRQGRDFAISSEGHWGQSPIPTGLAKAVELRPRYVKVSSHFTQALPNIAYQAIGITVVELAASFNAQVVAEGVDGRSEAEQVIALGIRYAQGALFGAPSDSPHAQCPDEVKEWISDAFYQYWPWTRPALAANGDPVMRPACEEGRSCDMRGASCGS